MIRKSYSSTCSFVMTFFCSRLNSTTSSSSTSTFEWLLSIQRIGAPISPGAGPPHPPLGIDFAFICRSSVLQRAQTFYERSTIEIHRMAVQTKTFDGSAVAPVPVPNLGLRGLEVPLAWRRYFTWFQLIVVYVFVERALWSSQIAARNKWVFIAAVTVLVFVVVDRPSQKRMGLGLPTRFGASLVLAVSFATAIFLGLLVRWAGGQIPANPMWPRLH